MKNKKISVIVNARTKSSRCPNKMSRPFAGSSLIAIALEKLSKLQNVEKYLCVGEDEFKKLLPYQDIKLLGRSYESLASDGSEAMYDHVSRLSSDYFMTFNPCFAHMSCKTLQSAIDYFLRSDCTTITSVIKCRDWLYNIDGTVLVDGSKTGNTKLSPLFYRVAHAFHIIDRVRFVDKHILWRNEINDPYLFEIDQRESLDIDTEFDFYVSESVFLRNKV